MTEEEKMPPDAEPEDEVENPEVHTVHTSHGRLPRWLELTIAVTALITSISSIAIAIHHGQIMEKLVQANSVPYMQGGFSNATPDGQGVLSLDLLNPGVGPAHEQSLRVKVGDTYVKSVRELIAASLGTERAAEAEEILNPSRTKCANGSFRAAENNKSSAYRAPMRTLASGIS